MISPVDARRVLALLRFPPHTTSTEDAPMPETRQSLRRAARRGGTAALAAAALLAACAATGPSGNAPPVEPRAGTWKTWVIASATEIRVPAPPDAAATAAE